MPSPARVLSLVALAALLACDDPRAAGRPASLLVGVYTYPWHGDDFHGGRYLRQHLDPPQPPVLGEYDDRAAEVIRQHADWSREAGIDCWIASWWGPDSREDLALRRHVLPAESLGDLRVAVHYETAGRTREFTDLDAAGPDFAHLAQHYFTSERYLRIEGKPVVVVYLTRVLEAKGLLERALRAMREGAGVPVYLVGDHAFGGPPESGAALGGLDAVTNYDVYGAMGASGHAGPAAVARYAAHQAAWRRLARDGGIAFVPSATPGFNDRAVRGGHAPLSRKLEPQAEFGSLFRALLREAVPLVDPGAENLLLVTSWNEWHEDTMIEPVEPAPATSKDDRGGRYTAGLEYEGYGRRYLEILSEETAR